MASKTDAKSLINKVMNNPELRQMLYGLAVLYLLAFWVVPLLLWGIHKITGWNL